MKNPPTGAIENGRENLRRLAEFYDFECDAGSLATCQEFLDARACFDAIAQWFAEQ